MTNHQEVDAASGRSERSDPAAPRASARQGEAGGETPHGLTIDAHQHFWRYEAVDYGWIDEPMASLRRDFLPQDLQPILAAHGVEGTIAVQARQTDEETAWLIGLAGDHPFVRGVVGWVDLRAENIAQQLERVAHASCVVGMRHVVQAEPDGFLDGAAFRRGIAALEPYDLVYDILIYERQLAEAARFAAAFPRQRFVLDHLGKPDVRGGSVTAWRRRLEDLAVQPHVWCKLSGLVTEADWRTWTPGQLRPYLDAALEAFGARRLLFGSDWPVCTVAAPYGQVVALVRDAIAEYSEAEQALMLGETAEEVYLS